MNNKFSVTGFENKTVEELRAMLADDTLLPLDDDSNTDTILKILEVIKSKEQKTDEQCEAERIAFWGGLLARYGNKLPVRLENVVRKRRRKPLALNFNAPAKYRYGFAGTSFRRLTAAAIIALVLLGGSALVTYAFNVNILQAIISFTDDLFSKTIVTTESVQSSGADGLTDSARTLQTAFDEVGITSPSVPTQLPDGYAFDRVQTGKMPDYTKVVVLYKSDDNKTIVFTVLSYDETPEPRTRHIEKNSGTPSVYFRTGIDFYLFANTDMTVATWLDGMCDCDIQGDISVSEMKSIINSIYSED
jgi:hypothetical protein